MSIVYTADVFCDKCSNWVHGTTGSKKDRLAKPALAIAKKEGWSRDTKSIYLDLCPHCLDEVRKGK